MTEPSDELCHIPSTDPLFQHYHDTEWGVPTNVDQEFFEKICLEGFQAGLSWRTILHRRTALRDVFSDFCPDALECYSLQDVERIMIDSRVIRNERKILSVLNNAKRFQELKRTSVSLAGLFWSLEPSIEQRPLKVSNAWLLDNAFTAESTTLARTLKKLGWSFVGPTTLYAAMQALGVVNDHVAGCPRKAQIDDLRMNFQRPAELSN